MADKRERNRQKKRLKVRFGIDVGKKMAFTGDLTQDGIFIITGQPEAPGSRIYVEISLPDQEIVVLKGRVRWAKKVPANLIRVANKAGMGVEIMGFEQGQSAFLRYLETLQ